MNTEHQLNIVSIDTKPEHDPYQNIDGIVSRTYLNLDPRDRTVWVSQEYKTNSTSMDEWNGLVLTWKINGHPSEADMREWIADNMEALVVICDGFEEHWNGNNHVGRFTTPEARDAADWIDIDFDNDGGPANYYEYYTVDSWLEHSRDQITADMTDEQLANLAQQWEPTEPQIVCGGRDSILEFITRIRDELKFEQEVFADDE